MTGREIPRGRTNGEIILYEQFNSLRSLHLSSRSSQRRAARRSTDESNASVARMGHWEALQRDLTDRFMIRSNAPARLPVHSSSVAIRHRALLPLISQTNSSIEQASRANSPCTNRQWKILAKVKVYGIRKDFYSTMMSSYSSWVPNIWEKIPQTDWDDEIRKLSSCVSRDTIFSLSNYSAQATVQSWSQQLGFSRHILNHRLYEFPVLETPTCIAQSKYGYLFVGYQSGRLVLQDLLDPRSCGSTYLSCEIGAFYSEEDEQRISEATLKTDAAVTHVIWTHNSPCSDDLVCIRLGRNIEGFIGDHHGRVFKFVIVPEGNKSLALKIVASVPKNEFHTDAICSMALDSEEKQLAVAGTDSIVRIWTHNPLATDPADVLKISCILRQFSAVRAMAFCPVLPIVFITGGGRHDRTLRIFDTKRGELSYQIGMPAQIVGIVWLNHVEILVALGHSRLKKYKGLGRVVNTLTGALVSEIPGDGYVLSALKTQDGFCLNTSTNDLIMMAWDSKRSMRGQERSELKRLSQMSPPLPHIR